MASRKARASFMLKRTANFLNQFKRNRRGLLGLGILIFFSTLALSASLLTPHDPAFGHFVSGDYAKPFWFRYFGDQYYSENFLWLSEPGFPKADSLFEEWNFTATTSPYGNISLDYDPTFGSKEPGAAVITFSRKAGKYIGDIMEVNLTKKLYFPYSAPPTRFNVQIFIASEGIEKLERVEVAIFLHQVGKNMSKIATYSFWSTTIYRTTLTWESPYPPLDSYHAEFRQKIADPKTDPARLIFPKQGDYILVIRTRFTDSPSTFSPIEAKVYLDDINIRFWGNSFGLLGTDYLGRDIFSQLAHGARISLFVGLLSATLSVIIGLALGLVSGYLGRIIDEILMRFTDMLLVLPPLPLLIVLIAVLGPSIWNLILLIGLLGWMGFARVVRSQVLSLKERPFIEAAKAAGGGKYYIIFRHILPNVVSLVYVSLALSVPSAILAEAALSWLGLFDPRIMSWGRMLHDAQFFQGIDKWWWIVPPGLCIAAVSLSFILLGYALDEILNPKLRQRR